MDKLEVRPLDTPNVINTRNRIRLCAAANLIGCILYIGINPYFSQPEASWAHLLHLLIEPFVIVASIVDRTVLAYLAYLASVFLACVDCAIVVLNVVAVNRCIHEPSAYCFDRLFESATWLLIAIWFIVFGVFQASQLYDLSKQLEAKDITEVGNQKMIVKDNKVPRFVNWISVYMRKIRILNLLLFLFDVTYVITLTLDSTELQLFWFGLVHILIDVLVYAYIGTISGELELSTTFAMVPFQIIRVVYILSLVCDIIVLWILLARTGRTFGEEIAVLLSILYCTTDPVQILYTSEWLIIADEHRAFQRKVRKMNTSKDK